MSYRVISHEQFLKRRALGTYRPRPRIRVREHRAVPVLVRTGNQVMYLGGIPGFIASLFLMGLRSTALVTTFLKRLFS